MSQTKEKFFLVIEGLDGSGKSAIAHRLTNILKKTYDQVKLTSEPHNGSCGGIFIRQLLMGRLKHVAPITVALAFAANRADHCDRVITPFLNGSGKRIIICDRYRLSSLVYQSSENISIADVYSLNSSAVQPDLTVYLNASDKTCYERMRRRGEDKELFEKYLSETRAKYYAAMDFLESRGETLVKVNADSSVEDVLNEIIGVLKVSGPDWLTIQPPLLAEAEGQVFSYDEDDEPKLKIMDVVREFSSFWNEGPICGPEDLEESLGRLRAAVEQRVSAMAFDDLGSLFLDLLDRSGYSRLRRTRWSEVDAYELEYSLPLDIVLRGVAILLGDAQTDAVYLKKILPPLEEDTDFLLVFAPGSSQVVNGYFDREVIDAGDKKVLSPAIHQIFKQDIAKEVLALAFASYYEEHSHTIRHNPDLGETLNQTIHEFALDASWDSAIHHLSKASVG